MEEYHPAYNNDNFAIVLTVSGGRNIKPTLKKSNIPVPPSDFHISTKNITGSYPYGQTSAMQITHQWKIAGKDLDSCNNVSYFNGHYYFAVEGTVAGVRLIKTKVISIKVECKFSSYNCFSMNNVLVKNPRLALVAYVSVLRESVYLLCVMKISPDLRPY